MEFRKRYKAYLRKDIEKIAEERNFPQEVIEEIKLLSLVFPFKTNNYVMDELIDWEYYKSDPTFLINFPQKEMLPPNVYNRLKDIYLKGNKEELFRYIHQIHFELNPHPAGQLQYNIPQFQGEIIEGIQHKYRETALVFPIQGQTCHAYCTFCFRWPQFIRKKEWKMCLRNPDKLVDYLQMHQEVQDLLITGGDPMIMQANVLRRYIDPIIEADIKHLKRIRIGSKTLSYWPYRYLSDKDHEDILDLFSEIVENKKHLAFMAHFNHPNELKTEAVKEAIKRILKTGAVIRTQSPILKHINDSPEVWSEMWIKQVNLGMIPYYMFIARDTGARHFFELPLFDAWKIYIKAYSSVSGLSRTVRGPVMSSLYGKIHVLGVNKLNNNEDVFVLRFIQARNPNWVGKPFFAKFNKQATWIDQLEPLFGDKFFFEKEKYLHAFEEDLEAAIVQDTVAEDET
ncbi:MAG: KamA family radical SAM protein [Candidatus Heimdallarchaeaceae archaeon]